MSALPAKTNRGGAKKPILIGLPIVIKSFHYNKTDDTSIEKFITSTSAEEQLGILKNIVEEQKKLIDAEFIKFLAVVFYEAPAKHHIKSFVSRHVTKSTDIQKSFTSFLTAHIVSEITREVNPHELEYYVERVPKIMFCTENFPSGALAVEGVSVDLLIKHLFFDYFSMCRRELRDSSLSPTKKNEMFNLEHVMLRLVVHVLQKLLLNENDLQNGPDIAQSIIDCIEVLICDEEVPMDTKSLSGILFLSAENLRTNTKGAWKILLEACTTKLSDGSNNCSNEPVLRHSIGRLAVYSAIATTVPMELLQENLVNTETPAVLVLLDELLSYADGSAASPGATVCVSRALLQLGRALDSANTAQAVPRLLSFVWRHLEYQLDSVRHLANQLLATCLQHTALLDAAGDPAPLHSLLRAVRGLGEARSFYWAVSRAAAALGAARVLSSLCEARALLRAACTQHLQAAACAAVTALLSHGACAGLSTEAVFERWLRPVVGCEPALRAILPAAADAHPPLLDYIGSSVRGGAALACARASPACRARLAPRALRAAAVHAHHETRMLALSLVCASGGGAAGVGREELGGALWALRHNMAAPRAAARAALLAHMLQLFKRLDDSARSLSRRGVSTEHYSQFIEHVRALCFAAALRGATHARRSTALQLLAGTHAALADVTRVWKPEYVECLLHHLDDSYDINKESALQVLQHCPLHLLEAATPSLTLPSVLAGAVYPRAGAGPAAAARLRLLLTRLPCRVERGVTDAPVREEVRPHYAVLQALLRQLHDTAALGGWREAAAGGAAGTLHCVAQLLRLPDIRPEDWREPAWQQLSRALAAASVAACARAEPVVANHAPEGYLPEFPQDATEKEDQRRVTAQMVLVSAWRAVKEGAGVLGARGAGGGYLVSLLTRALHRGAVEQAAAGLAAVATSRWATAAGAAEARGWARELLQQVARGPPHATRRGAGLPAAIQAIVSAEVAATGRAECFNECMEELLVLAAAGDQHASARRTLAANVLRALYKHTALEKVSQPHVAAGLRLALQGFEAVAWPERTAMSLLFCALVVRIFGVSRVRGTETHARNTLPAQVLFSRYPGSYDACMSKLLEFSPTSIAGPSQLPVLLLLARLYPSAAEGAASSLKVRSFVPLVQRCACSAELRVRRLAARALPALLPTQEHFSYIERLFEAISQPNLLYNHWHGALLTLACLLERATPDDTQGHVTTSESQVNPNMSSTEKQLAPNMASNGSQGASHVTSGESQGAPSVSPVAPGWVSRSMHALSQATGARPCYVVAREYINVLNLLIWKWPGRVPPEPLSLAGRQLEQLVSWPAAPGPDRELCLADATLLYFIVLQRLNEINKILPLINRTLQHTSYEVILATLDYLLLQKRALAIDQQCSLRLHLQQMRQDSTLGITDTYDYMNMITKLSHIYHTSKYQECKQKSLQLLSLEDNTQMLVINERLPTDCDDVLAEKLICLIEKCHESLKHLYLESLLNLARNKEVSFATMVEIKRVVYECGSAENSAETRMLVVTRLADSLTWNSRGDDAPSDLFRVEALELGTLVTLLEDDDEAVRQSAADVVVGRYCGAVRRDTSASDATCEDMAEMVSDGWRTLQQALLDNGGRVSSSAAGALLRRWLAGGGALPRRGERHAALALLLALIDFRAEVCCNDDLTDECRVFDQSERYNINLEESEWTVACADIFIQLNKDLETKEEIKQEIMTLKTKSTSNLVLRAESVIKDPRYCQTFTLLCNDNVRLFLDMVQGSCDADDNVNPKIGVLMDRLRGH